MSTLRILVSGDINGNFAQCFERVNIVNRKSGPFDMLLCVGDFFGDKTIADLTDSESDIVLPSVPAYILGPLHERQVNSYKKVERSEAEFDSGFELIDGITFLGKKGILTGTSGLKIAYLSGRHAEKSTEFTFDEEDAKHVILAAKSSSSVIDILITSQWPIDIERHLPDCPPGVVEAAQSGSQIISKLAYEVKPRYHFTSSCSFLERQPYRNHRVIQEMGKQVTRFISLAPVGNKAKSKWLYAFNVTPSQKLNRNELIQQPTDTTECPYVGLSYIQQAVKEADEKPNQYFYDMSLNGMGEGYGGRGKRRRGRNDDYGKRQDTSQKPKDPCWFCLASPEVEKHLIVSIGDHSYLAMAKGGLVNYHLLIIPIAHFRSMLEAVGSDENLVTEMSRFKKALNDFFVKKDKIVVYFERNFRSSHLQIQAVPVPMNLRHKLKDMLIELSEERDVHLNSINEDLELKDVISTGIPYFYIEIPSTNVKLFCKINAGKGFPLQFGREILAHPHILNLSDRIDWKDCALSKDDATEVTAEFRKEFEPFDFTL